MQRFRNFPQKMSYCPISPRWTKLYQNNKKKLPLMPEFYGIVISNFQVAFEINRKIPIRM